MEIKQKNMRHSRGREHSMAVHVIKKKQVANVVEVPAKKLRTACYARISTDSDLQELSLEAQEQAYGTMIKSNPEWEYAGMYTDDGISGTQMKKTGGLERTAGCGPSGRD